MSLASGGGVVACGLAWVFGVDPYKVIVSFDFDIAGEWTQGAEDIARIIAMGILNILLPILLLFSAPVYGYMFATDQADMSIYEMPVEIACAILASFFIGTFLSAWGAVRSCGFRLFLCAFFFWSAVLYVLLPTLTFLAITAVYVAAIAVLLLGLGLFSLATNTTQRQ